MKKFLSSSDLSIGLLQWENLFFCKVYPNGTCFFPHAPQRVLLVAELWSLEKSESRFIGIQMGQTKERQHKEIQMPNTQGIEEKGIAINVNVCFLGVCLF